MLSTILLALVMFAFERIPHEKCDIDPEDRICRIVSVAPGWEVSMGTCMIIDDMHVLSCNHVIRSRTLGVVRRGEILSAELIAVDPSNDWTMLRLTKPTELKPLRIGNELKEGDFAFCYGYGQQNTKIFSIAVRNNQNRLVGGQVIPGDSGGPILDASGAIIGVTTHDENNGEAVQGRSATQGLIRKFIEKSREHKSKDVLYLEASK